MIEDWTKSAPIHLTSENIDKHLILSLRFLKV